MSWTADRPTAYHGFCITGRATDRALRSRKLLVVVDVCQINMGMIGFDRGRRNRRSEPRNAAMISLTICRKKIIANTKRDSQFALAA